MKPTIKLISWDLDDTLWPLHSTQIINNANKTVYTHLKNLFPFIPELTSYELFQKKCLKFASNNTIWEYDKTKGRFNWIYSILIPHMNKEKALQEASIAMNLFIAKRSEVIFYPSILSNFIQLSKHVDFACMSNGNADLNSIGIKHLFQYDSSSIQAKSAKPNPDIFNYLINLCQYHPKDILHIGNDLELDIIPAQKAGLHSLWIQHECDQKKTSSSLTLSLNKVNQLYQFIIEHFHLDK